MSRRTRSSSRASLTVSDALGLTLPRLESLVAGRLKNVNSPVSCIWLISGYVLGINTMADLRVTFSSCCLDAVAIIVLVPEEVTLSAKKKPLSNSASQSPTWFVTMTNWSSSSHWSSAVWKESVSLKVTATESSEQSTVMTD